MRTGHSQEDAFGAPPDQPVEAKVRYFFDVQDGALSFPDEDGTELCGNDEAAAEAARILVELAKGRLPHSKHRELTVCVRGERGAVLKATLSFGVEPLSLPAPDLGA